MFRCRLKLKPSAATRGFGGVASSQCALRPEYHNNHRHHHQHSHQFSTQCCGMQNYSFSLPAAVRTMDDFHSIRCMSSKSSMATTSFQSLVQSLKSTKQTCTIIESSCGGLISSSLMSVPGSSAVYYGGTVAYNTKKSGKLLCGDEELHGRLLNAPSAAAVNDEDLLDAHPDLSEEAREYVKSKLHWTRQTALSYCDHVQTDFAIAEGESFGIFLQYITCLLIMGCN